MAGKEGESSSRLGEKVGVQGNGASVGVRGETYGGRLELLVAMSHTVSRKWETCAPLPPSILERS